MSPVVKLIAHTTLVDPLLAETGDGDTPMQQLVEYAGRTCYQSFHRPSDVTNTPNKYIRSTVGEKKHYSILEHASATFEIRGVSRAFLAEITRHRHLSFSVLSQRFVDGAGAEFTVPPAVADSDEASEILREHNEAAKAAYAELQAALSGSRKEINEAARAVLPNNTSVDMIVSGNLRAWREVLQRRIQPDVDAEFQAVAKKILELITPLAPAAFEDVKPVIEEPLTFDRAMRMVYDWNEKAGHLDSFHGDWDKNEDARILAANIFLEEAKELYVAVRSDDVEETIDAIADVLFTLFGIVAKGGYTPVVEAAFKEVCRSNDSKLGDNMAVNNDGKIGKSNTYEPPNLTPLRNMVYTFRDSSGSWLRKN